MRKPIFAVRTNVSYEPLAAHRPPVPLELVVGFDVKDFLHIKEVYFLKILILKKFELFN
jgi:hypothetical protein